MSEIVVESVTADDSVVRSEVSYTRDLRRFFTGRDLYVAYGTDVSDVPESILSIPVLAHVCPVAWATGATVRVPTVDETFYGSLTDVNHALAEMYPEFIRRGTAVEYGELADEPVGPCEDSALLFSGGVDSIATFIRHHEEDPALVSVHGWTVAAEDDDAWEEIAGHLRTFGEEQDVENLFVESNMHAFLDTPMLHAHYKRYLVGSWYSGVGHGIGLLGLCAPLTVATGIGQLYMASTQAEGFSHPWGSHPTIDSQVRWAETTADHDGYEITRQDKMGLIADFVREESPDLEVRTCNSGGGDNCSRCEKCCRTAVGFALEGIDPADHGFDVDGETFAYVRDRLESGEWISDENFRFQWHDIRNHLEADGEGDYPYPEVEEFVRWFAATDIDEELVDRLEPPAHHQVVQTIARHTPYPLYARLYPVYRSVKSGVRSQH